MFDDCISDFLIVLACYDNFQLTIFSESETSGFEQRCYVGILSRARGMFPHQAPKSDAGNDRAGVDPIQLDGERSLI